jgi:hypothetical protein
MLASCAIITPFPPLGSKRTNHAKEGSKDDVERNVGKARDGRRTAAEQGRSGRARARRIGNKGRRGGVKVATASKLDNPISSILFFSASSSSFIFTPTAAIICLTEV